MLPDKKLQTSLIDIAKKYRDESYVQRMAVAQRVNQARNYMKGLAADWSDGYNWWGFDQHPDEGIRGSAPKGRRHFNIYQSSWRKLQGAIQTAGIPGSIFLPQNANQPDDMNLARNSKMIIDYERQVIDYRALWMKGFRLDFTDGVWVGYVRHQKNADKYGTSPGRKEVLRDIVTQEAGYKCSQCGAFALSGEVPRDQSGNLQCPNCDAPMGAQQYVEQQVGQVADYQDIVVPNGREVVDIYGAIETEMPWWVNRLEDCDYVKIIEEVGPEDIIPIFPEAEKDIMGGTGDGSDFLMGKWARTQARQPQFSRTFTNLSRFITYQRLWFRPQCFYREESADIRAELLKQFSQGCFFQLAGDEIFLDSLPERMNDHLVIHHAMDGDGMYTPSLGQNLVPVQEITNTCMNLIPEAIEYASFPAALIDSTVLSGVGMNDTRMKPGSYKEITLPPGKNLRDCIYQMEVKESSVAINSFLASLDRWCDELSGTSAALSGDPMTNTRSAEQYNAAKNQSLQQLAPTYEAMKKTFAEIDELIVHAFDANRTEPEYFAIVGENGDLKKQAIEIAPKEARIYARAEESTSVPQTFEQRQAAVYAILQSQSKELQASSASPNNQQEIYLTLGLTDWEVPGADEQEKVEKMIQMMLQGQPMKFDPVLDDATVALSVVRHWASQPENLAVQQSNPQGFMSIYQFAQSAMQQIMQAQAAANAPKPPAESISYKDLEPEGKVQMASQAGLQIPKPKPVPIAASPAASSK